MKKQAKVFALRLSTLCLCIALLLTSLLSANSVNLTAKAAGESGGTGYTGYFVGRSGEYNLSGEIVHQTTRLPSEQESEYTLTVFVYGQGGDISNWSHDADYNFEYDPDSLIEKLRNDFGGDDDAKVYLASTARDSNKDKKDDTKPTIAYNENVNKLSFILQELAVHNNAYSYTMIRTLESPKKNTIVVFDGSNSVDCHKNVYIELHTVIDRISFDIASYYKKLPKVNLISHSRGGIISMMYASGYRAGSKTAKVEYSNEPKDGYFDVGDGLYEKQQSYSTNGSIIYDHPYNVNALYSLGSPYEGTKLDQPWARVIEPQMFNSPSAKNINDQTIQNEIKDCWEHACTENPDLKLYAYGGEISLNFIIGLLGDETTEIINSLPANPNIFSSTSIEYWIDYWCPLISGYLIPFFKDALQHIITYGPFFVAGSLLLPVPFNVLIAVPTNEFITFCASLLPIADAIGDAAENIGSNASSYTLSQKLLVIDGLLLDLYDFFDNLIGTVLGLTSARTGINSIGDFGDLVISKESQLADGFTHVESYSKKYAYEGISITNEGSDPEFSYVYRNFDINKKAVNMLAVPHNLEPYDSELHNRIRDRIRLKEWNYFDDLKISLASGSTMGNWKVKIENDNPIEATIVYNERMCFEGDAANFQHLTNLRSFRLSSGGERTVTITGNGTAGYIVIAVSCIMPSGKAINLVFYANGLNASTLTMNTIKRNVVDMGPGGQGNVDLVPNYLDFEIVRKNGSTWKIKLKNSSDEQVSVTYNSKMCFDDAARNFYGLRDLVDVTIPANGARIVDISENFTACFITAAINYTVDGVRYRRITSADGLNANGSINTPRYHEVVVACAFPEINTPAPSYVTMTPISKSGFIWYTWRVQITNGNSFPVEVSYNAKLCFENDAKNFNNLSDIVSVMIPANGSVTVTINHNGTAGWMVASLNYSYNGYEYRRITYADGIRVGGTNTPKHNEIRTS